MQPLHTVTTRSVVKTLTQLISVFEIPKTIQSDRGSNVMFRVFAEISFTLSTEKVSTYHVQSKGAHALLRLDQTLKSLLRSYCAELGCDWGEGLPWLLLAAQWVRRAPVLGHMIFRLVARFWFYNLVFLLLLRRQKRESGDGELISNSV